jgi:hypothetical protein
MTSATVPEIFRTVDVTVVTQTTALPPCDELQPGAPKRKSRVIGSRPATAMTTDRADERRRLVDEAARSIEAAKRIEVPDRSRCVAC